MSSRATWNVSRQSYLPRRNESTKSHLSCPNMTLDSKASKLKMQKWKKKSEKSSSKNWNDDNCHSSVDMLYKLAEGNKLHHRKLAPCIFSLSSHTYIHTWLNIFGFGWILNSFSTQTIQFGWKLFFPLPMIELHHSLATVCGALLLHARGKRKDCTIFKYKNLLR